MAYSDWRADMSLNTLEAQLAFIQDRISVLYSVTDLKSKVNAYEAANKTLTELRSRIESMYLSDLRNE